MNARIWFVLVCCVLTEGPARAQQPAGLDPHQLYQAAKSKPVTYDVDFSVVITPPYKAKQLKVWLPIPPTDTSQEVSDSKLSSFPIAVQPQIATEEKFGNRFACFVFDAPQGAQIVRHQFRVKVWELSWNVDPARVVSPDAWPASFDRYRQGESQAVVVDERVQNLLATIVPAKAAPIQKLGGALDWVQSNLVYDHHEASLQASSEHALTKRRGHCSDYHGLCAAFGRAMGMPTRVTYGINPFPKNSPSHCKLEVFLPPYGWVSFDVSETQRLTAAIRDNAELSAEQKQALTASAQARLARGFRDNTWFLQTRGTDYDLAPKASRKVSVVRTAWVEADGQPLPDPDPADKTRQAFSWMTVHEYRADRPAPSPFTDWKTLLAPQESP